MISRQNNIGICDVIELSFANVDEVCANVNTGIWQTSSFISIAKTILLYYNDIYTLDGSIHY
jgi:hypothetical protein